jgi:hypothetical protein
MPRASSFGPARLPRRLALAAALATAGCGAQDPPRIVGLLGCGLEGDVFTRLRVAARGDFPPTSESQLLVSSGVSDLDVDNEEIDGVTIEGLFGDTVTAVGRTARLGPSGELPVYFAPADQWCAVSSAVTFRDAGDLTVGAEGDVLVVGGRDAAGRLLDDVVTMRDETNVAMALAAGLPVPSTGHSVHPLDDRRFAVVGGASVNPTALDSVVFIDILDDGGRVSDPVRIDLPAEDRPGRAYHGAAAFADGRILVTGGCTGLGLMAECLAGPDTVLRSSFWLTPTPEGLLLAEPGPVLDAARYGHRLHIARDEVAFVAGGLQTDDSPRQQPERLLPGADAFEAYGPPLSLELLPETTIESSALLDGGMLVLAMSDGTLRWITETETGALSEWCIDEGDPCFATPADAGIVRPPRTLTALPGERILADGWIAPVGGLGQSGAHAIDLSAPSLQVTNPPPGARAGARAVVLPDGSVLLAGGRDPTTSLPVQPFFVRLRPALDGPDEEIPDVDDLRLGSLLALQADRVRLEDGVVRLLSAGLREEFPSVRARARGFRSQRFRFEVSLRSDEADPHVVLEQGAVAGISIRFEATRIRAFIRDAQGRVLPVSCGTTPLDFTSPQVMGIEVTPETIRIRRGIEEIGQCPGPGQVPSAVGIGASGSGTVEASTLRLTRI